MLQLLLPAFAAVEFDCALHGLDSETVGVSAESLEHADEVACVSDCGAEAFAEALYAWEFKPMPATT